MLLALGIPLGQIPTNNQTDVFVYLYLISFHLFPFCIFSTKPHIQCPTNSQTTGIIQGVKIPLKIITCGVETSQTLAKDTADDTL